MKKLILTIVIYTLFLSNIIAQNNNKKQLEYSNRLTLLAGLIQPLALSGGNFQVDYNTKRMVFDYSHGFSLDPPVVGDYKDQNLALHLPFSVGFGIGYRLTSNFDIRFEPKYHGWEVYYKDEDQNDKTRIADFKTVTLGIGAYYRIMPFKKSSIGFLKNIALMSSVRWWQNTSSTIDNDEFKYFNKTTNKVETFKTPNIGLANTPLIINFGLGYTFGGK